MKSALNLRYLTTLIALGVSASAFAAPELKYSCMVRSSNSESIASVSTISIDPSGQYIVYEDSDNNCNGVKESSHFSRSSFYRTDCEWDGFVEVVIDSQMSQGAPQGKVRVRSKGSSYTHALYDCTLLND